MPPKQSLGAGEVTLHSVGRDVGLPFHPRSHIAISFWFADPKSQVTPQVPHKVFEKLSRELASAVVDCGVDEPATTEEVVAGVLVGPHCRTSATQHFTFHHAFAGSRQATPNRGFLRVRSCRL